MLILFLLTTLAKTNINTINTRYWLTRYIWNVNTSKYQLLQILREKAYACLSGDGLIYFE